MTVKVVSDDCKPETNVREASLSDVLSNASTVFVMVIDESWSARSTESTVKTLHAPRNVTVAMS